MERGLVQSGLAAWRFQRNLPVGCCNDRAAHGLVAYTIKRQETTRAISFMKAVGLTTMVAEAEASAPIERRVEPQVVSCGDFENQSAPILSACMRCERPALL